MAVLRADADQPGLAALFLLVVVNAGAASAQVPGPLLEGRYVVDPADCALSEFQVDGIGEGAAARVRTLSGATIDYHYPGSCRIETGDVGGTAFVFTRICSFEGDLHTYLDMWEIESPAAFRDGGLRFTLCAATAAGPITVPASSIGPASMDDPDTVRTVQIALHRLGFGPVSVDGRMGPQTRRAMNAFQRQNGLAVTRELDRRTLELLIERDSALFGD